MEAKELMIGDWVHYTEYKCYRKVSSIDPLSKYVGLGYKYSNGFTSHDYCDLRKVSPIPLTPEILKKNGWIFDDLSGEWFNIKAIRLYGRNCKDLSMLDGNIIINSVHELQHALRLCGLNELADNLKIE